MPRTKKLSDILVLDTARLLNLNLGLIEVLDVMSVWNDIRLLRSVTRPRVSCQRDGVRP